MSGWGVPQSDVRFRRLSCQIKVISGFSKHYGANVIEFILTDSLDVACQN
jgi:hypothetical protein